MTKEEEATKHKRPPEEEKHHELEEKEDNLEDSEEDDEEDGPHKKEDDPEDTREGEESDEEVNPPKEEDGKDKYEGGKEVGAHRQNKISVTRPNKAPDEAKEKPDKTIDVTVAMATYTRDKDGAGIRLDKTCVEGQEKYSETEPAKAPAEVFDSETETSSDLETGGGEDKG